MEMGEPKVEQGTELEQEISVISEDLLNVSTDVLEVLDSFEEDDWPLTQLSERAPSHRTPEGKEKKPKVRDSLSMQEQLTYDREVYKERAYAAPSIRGGVEATQHLGFVPSPLKAAEWKGSGAKNKAPQKNVHPKCFRCDHEVRAKDASRKRRPVKCDGCSAIFHFGCAGLTHPPRFGSWACDGCKRAM